MSGSAPPGLTTQANGIAVLSDQYLNGLVQGGALLANARAFNNALSNMTIYLVGLSTPGDSGAGAFYWNSASTATDDGGLTTIQPNGLLTGRWLRISGSTTQSLPLVPNIAAFRALTTAPGAAVYVLGYYTATDGGEGTFWYNSADTTSADNGGTIIVDASGRRWYREGKELGVWELAWFGPAGNGTTGDSAVINGALTALSTAGGGSLRIAAKQYLLNETVTVPPYCVLRGNLWPGGETSANVYTGMPFTLILSGADTTISLSSQSGISGMTLLSSVYTGLPENLQAAYTLVNSYTGTAITNGGQDTFCENLFILAFAQAYSSTNYQRMHLRNIIGDNAAGIYINNCQDTGRVESVHWWNYLTANQTWSVSQVSVSNVADSSGLFSVTTSTAHGLATGNQVAIGGVGGTTGANGRWTITVTSTTAFTLNSSTFSGSYTSGGTVTALAPYQRFGAAYEAYSCDVVAFSNCDSWGYDTGFLITGGYDNTLIGCAADTLDDTGDSVPVGLWMTGGTQGNMVLGGFLDSHAVSVLNDTGEGLSSSNSVVGMIFSPGGGGSNYVVYSKSGALSVTGCTIDPGPNNANIYVGDGTTFLALSGCAIDVAYAFETAFGTGQSNTFVDGRPYAGYQINMSETGANVTIRSNAGAPVYTAAAGSMYLRSDGTTGSRLYVSAGSGTWNAVSGV